MFPTDTGALYIQHAELAPYLDVWQAMKKFCVNRTPNTPDQVWFLQHPPVFTQGVSGKPEHVLNAGNIPIIQSDRGGQVTYHGPGQLMMYVLLDLHRLDIGVRTLVDVLENTAVNILKQYGISAIAKKDAPGVYVKDEKIASLGLRVKKGLSYHGLSFNVDMDLTPFSQINPCGFKDLKITQLSHHGVNCRPMELACGLLDEFAQQLGYKNIQATDNTFTV
ncbi:MAG: octanoyltransferase [Cycloclasticus sp. symbiont of Poecilosclerida sp. M]|nr:MAG: octanoyltransferase [Cycloclasticus sp. symbiont of Poecilosclerida sp. M]